MTFLFLIKGLGEFSQAEALAKFARHKKIECLFIIKEEIKHYAKMSGFKYKIASPQKSQKIVEKIKPNVIIFCNSKTHFVPQKPWFNPVTVSLDSNWLFGQTKSWEVYDWIDKFFLVFPKKIFELGLKQNGGFYEISPKNLKKIQPIGFIPSAKVISKKDKYLVRKKLNLKENEKLIFGYFGKGITYRPLLLPKLIEAVEELNKRRDEIRIFWSGPHLGLRKKFIIGQYRLSTKDFRLILGSSDLIVQHHGLGTLAQAICAQIPAITFTPTNPFKKSIIFRHSESYEIEAFKKAGVCQSIAYQENQGKLVRIIDNLLYNEKERRRIKNNQKAISAPGEETAYNEILRLLNKRSEGV